MKCQLCQQEILDNKSRVTTLIGEQVATVHRTCGDVRDIARRAGWEQAKQQAMDICKADIQEHAITISAAQQETHNNCCNYLAKAIGLMEYKGESK